MAAIEGATNLGSINPKGYSFQGTYRRGREPVDVWRVDKDGGGKDFPTRGARDGIPLLIHGNAESDIVIVVEGEKAARAIQRAGFTRRQATLVAGNAPTLPTIPPWRARRRPSGRITTFRGNGPPKHPPEKPPMLARTLYGCLTL